MLELRFLLPASVLFLSTAWIGAALADVPPPDACTPNSAVGAPCSNAGPANDQPGTCQNGMCPHTGPGPDGGIVTTEYACMICTESSGSGGGGTSGNGGKSCTVGAVGGEGTLTGTMMLIGLAALLADRRSRGPSRSRRSRR